MLDWPYLPAMINEPWRLVPKEEMLPCQRPDMATLRRGLALGDKMQMPLPLPPLMSVAILVIHPIYPTDILLCDLSCQRHSQPVDPQPPPPQPLHRHSPHLLSQLLLVLLVQRRTIHLRQNRIHLGIITIHMHCFSD